VALKESFVKLNVHSAGLSDGFAGFFVEMLLASGSLGATPMLFAGFFVEMLFILQTELCQS